MTVADYHSLPTSAYDCTGDGSNGPKRLIIFVNGAPYSMLSADSFDFKPGGYVAKNLAVYMNGTTFFGKKVDVASLDLPATNPSFLSFPQNAPATDTADIEGIMERYANLGGNSGISAYELGADYINVQFDDGRTYTYDYRTPGARDVERMKQLARAGRGLNSFISTQVRKRYAAKC